MKKKLLKTVVLLGLSVTACSSPPQATRSIADVSDEVSFFTTPKDLHRTWLRAIGKAQESVFMEMFHLTDEDVVKALRAKSQSVEITLILD
jgi:hypothetical protein